MANEKLLQKFIDDVIRWNLKQIEKEEKEKKKQEKEKKKDEN